MENPATLAFFAVPSVTTDAMRVRMVSEVSLEMVCRTTVGSACMTVFPSASMISETM